jgi:hypothetical protein
VIALARLVDRDRPVAEVHVAVVPDVGEHPLAPQEAGPEFPSTSVRGHRLDERAEHALAAVAHRDDKVPQGVEPGASPDRVADIAFLSRCVDPSPKGLHGMP